jgi:diguanylate cyclase (GGDEF)-like protein
LASKRRNAKMLNSMLSKKEFSLLSIGTFVSSAFFAFLFLIELAVYLKLVSAFLLIFFLWGWGIWIFKREKKRYQLLIKEQDTKSNKFLELTELAAQICQASFSLREGADFFSKIKLFFKEFFDSDTFLFFAKRGNIYQMITASNVTLPERRRLFFKSNSEFVSVLRSTEEGCDLGFVESIKIPQTFNSLQKEHEINFVIPLRTELDLWGFVVLKRDRKLAPAEQKLANVVFNQWALTLQKENLWARLGGMEKKLNLSLSRFRSDLSSLNKDLKRKIFDLNAVLGMVNNLYSIPEEERLFTVFSKMIQDHLGTKSVLIMLPEEKKNDIVAKYSFGTQLGNLADLVIEKGKGLYGWIKNSKELWSLYDLRKLSEEERVLKRFLSEGFQIGAKLPFTQDRFGLVLLGEKSDGSKYRQIDLGILAILISMVMITYKNIKHYRTIEELSYTDSMTGLYNYRYFYKRLTEEVFRAKRFSRKLALVIFDIDDFKIYNDTYGHQAGDCVLKQLGELLSLTVRSIDIVSRYGGEEFCVIMPESDQEECFKFMERLRKAIMNHSFKDENLRHEHNITVSLGGAIYPHDARTVDRIIYCADMALLTAKSLGRNKSVMSAEKNEALKNSLSAGEPVKIIHSMIYGEKTNTSQE